MVDRYYLTDGGHILISGSTGAKAEYGGKTTTSNWWFEQSVQSGWNDFGVFVNPKGHSSIRGNTVSTLKGFAESYRAGNRLFDFRTDNADGVVKMMKQLPGRKIVVFDEAQSYADSDEVGWVLSQGGNLDSGSFTALTVTQRPWNLSEEWRANMPVKVWCGPVTPEGERFFRSESMGPAIEKVKEDMAPYHWAVTDGGEYQHTNAPVPKEYA